MTLRLRLTLVATAVVAVVLGGASLTVYYVMRHDLFRQVDTQIRQQATQVQTRPETGFRRLRPARTPTTSRSSARPARSRPAPRSRSTPRSEATATGSSRRLLPRRTVIQGHHWREIVAPLLPPFTGAVVVAAPVDNLTTTSTACD